MKHFLLIIILISTSISVSSQTNSFTLVTDTTTTTLGNNFFEIQNNFNDYWSKKDVVNGYYTENGIRKKAYGWKQFKRWEWYWMNRINPTTGAFPSKHAPDFFTPRNNSNGNRNATGNWTSMGPTTSTGGYSGIGRLNCIVFRSGDNNTLYAGSPSGGLWKTTDGGTNWSVLTDDNAVLGVSDAVVVAGATTATDIVYIGTGDRDGGSMWSLGGGQSNDNNSVGVLKSTDGGTTWATTGLTFTTNQKETVNRMLIDPGNSSIVYAATSDGLYKTSDAGANWTKLSIYHFADIEFKPGDSQTIYASSRFGSIYKSTDAGVNWTSVFDNYSTNGRRINLAVSANEPTWVYAVEANTSGGLFGIYKSTDSGGSYSLIFNSTNILNGDCSPVDADGQGSYDLAIACDPTNANTLFVGGVNTWKSTDGGVNWSINNMWSGTCSGAAINVHADKHFLAYQNGTSNLFECNDGGLYTTSDAGSTWSHIGNGLIVSQLYRLGVSQVSSDKVIAGLQDNGTKAKSSGAWTDVLGGDGMDCMIDYTDDNIQYGESQYGNLYRTDNNWASSTGITSGLTGYAWWVTAIAIDPNVNTTIYTARQDVFKSTDKGANWTKISNFGTYQYELAIAPSNSNYIYTTSRSALHRTTDGGTTWTDITGTLPTGSSSITYIAVKDDDPNTVWVSFGQYTSDCVYETTDGGSTWTDISAGLPTIPVMCVVQNKLNTSQNELYAGTDVGVYVKVDGGAWALYSDGLPNVVVNEIKIYYNSTTPSLSRLRAATSGRGMWESEIYTSASTPPVTDFEASNTTPGINSTVTFTDRTVNDPTSWNWSFSPSTIKYKNNTTSSSQNPQVEFLNTGTYQVSLTSTNVNGSDSETKAGYISASSAPSGYAEAYSTNPYGYISRVQIGSIDKLSNYTNVGNPDPDDKYYEDWTANSTDVVPGQSYNITVTSPYSNSNLDLGIWIDSNRDGDFDDSQEQLLCDIDGGGQGTFSISIPTDADVGNTRMRIRIKYYGSCNPNGSTSNGEVEDYTLNIIPASTTWNGTNSNWNDESNWPNNVVPNLSYGVTVPSVPANGSFPIIPSGTNAQCYSLELQSGATITINGNLEIEK